MGSRPDPTYYRDAEQRDFLVMRVCMYLRGGEPCRGCPRWEQDRRGPVRRMCRMMAEELIAVVHQSLAKGPEVVAQDNEPWPALHKEED